jgi:hypothetical protein
MYILLFARIRNHTYVVCEHNESVCGLGNIYTNDANFPKIVKYIRDQAVAA